MDSQFDKIMKRAGEKINFARTTLMGPGGSVRNDIGFSYTANRILTANANFLDLGASNMFSLNDAMAAGMKKTYEMSKNNFSASDLGTVQDMDVVDIAIASTVASHGLTYVAMERAMKAVKQNIEFQRLIAVNTAAGFSAGDIVIDPRQAISSAVDLGRNGAGKTDASLNGTDGVTDTVALGVPVIAGTTLFYYDATGTGLLTTLVAYTSPVQKPVAGVEAIVSLNGLYIKSGTVTPATGAVSVVLGSTLTAGKIVVKYFVDRIAETDGANTLKLRPQLDSQEIVAVENRVILQTSVEVQAQMNKIFRENSQYGVDVDYGKRAIDQVVQLYTYYIDVNIIRALWAGIVAKPVAVSVTMSLAGYNSSGYTAFAETKNDRISLFVRKLCSTLLTATGSPVTALIADEVGALMLASDNTNFVEDPAFRQRRDGLIGMYNNIPLIRNVYLNGKGTSATYGTVIGVHKSLNGEASPVVFGDYLPPYSTIAAINPNNPGELAQALFSQTATKCVVPEFIVRGEIIPFTAGA